MPVTLPLTTDRLLIAPMTVTDAPELAEYRSDPAVARYQSWASPYPLADAERMLAANPAAWPGPGQWLQLGLRADGVLVGDVAVHPQGDPQHPATVEVGVTVARRSQRRGFAFEALSAVLDAVVADGAHRVFATCDARNTGVASVFTRLGMRREARLVDAEWWKDEWTTADTWAVLADEWLG